MAPLMTSARLALIWPSPALDPDGLLRSFAALLIACVVAALPRRWGVAGTTALVVALVFLRPALIVAPAIDETPRSQCRGFFFAGLAMA